MHTIKTFLKFLNPSKFGEILVDYTTIRYFFYMNKI